MKYYCKFFAQLSFDINTQACKIGWYELQSGCIKTSYTLKANQLSSRPTHTDNNNNSGWMIHDCLDATLPLNPRTSALILISREAPFPSLLLLAKYLGHKSIMGWHLFTWQAAPKHLRTSEAGRPPFCLITWTRWSEADGIKNFYFLLILTLP